MNIDVKDVITLNDNNKYVVCAVANYFDKKYYYLVDIKDNANIKFCYEKDSNIIAEVNDSELIRNLLPLFVKNRV